MNWDQVEGKWNEMSGKAQSQWGKLTNDELDVIKGRSEIAPHRFTDKTFSRRKAFSSSDDAYSISIDGLPAGRIMKKTVPGQKGDLVLVNDCCILSHQSTALRRRRNIRGRSVSVQNDVLVMPCVGVKIAGKVTWYGVDQ